MNAFNLTNGSIVFDKLDPEYDFLNKVSNAIGYYVISIVSLLGFILNLFGIQFLSDNNLKHKFYKYLQCKLISDLFVCLIGIGYLNNSCSQCFENQCNKYGIIFYQWYIIKIPNRIVFLASAFAEIFLTINRYFTLNAENKRHWLNNISATRLIVGFFVVPIILFFPSYFISSIEYSPFTQCYSMVFNGFGHSLGINLSNFW